MEVSISHPAYFSSVIIKYHVEILLQILYLSPSWTYN